MTAAQLQTPNGEIHLVISTQALGEIRADPRKGEALAWCALSFRYFLRFWHFLDQESSQQRLLGEVLWPGQEVFVESMDDHKFIYALKARKLGFTTIEQAYDAWCARFRGPNERVHLFSRRDDAAKELLRNVKYGLDRLPSWMKLPYALNKSDEVHLYGSDDDTRIIKAYPADEDTAVEATCTHGHVDEWARMRNPQRVWQALEPSMAGTCHIITTGMGPGNFSSTFWLMTKQGDTPFHPFFVKATMRPDRTEAWVIAKRKSMPENDARREYPMTDKDSLYAGANLLFSGDNLEEVGNLGMGPQPAEEGHDYIKAWDIGRHKDAAVCVVWDFSKEPWEIVNYERMRGQTYPMIQQHIESMHVRYPGMTVIEKNAAGEAVAENLELADDEWDLWTTSAGSKARMLTRMQMAIQDHDVAWSKTDFPQLHAEFDAYQLPDDKITQDSVMAACIGLGYHIDPKRKRKRPGRARVVSLG